MTDARPKPHPIPPGVLLPRIEPLTARQIELSQHDNVQRRLVGVYNAANRINAIVTEYEEPPAPAATPTLLPPPPKP